MAFFRYKLGKATGLGTGASAYGLIQPQSLPAKDGFNVPGYAVRGAIRPQAPGYVKLDQYFTPVALVGNGIDIQGQLELQRLAQMQGQ